MKSREIAVLALCAALSVALMYMTSIIPTGRLAMLAVASAITAVAVIRCGKRGGLAVFLVASALGLLLVPSKGLATAYCLLFGHYAIFKSLIEGIGKRPLEWALKLCVFLVCLTALYFLARLVFEVHFPVPDWVLFVGGSVVFVIYDLALTELIGFIVKRTGISKGGKQN